MYTRAHANTHQYLIYINRKLRQVCENYPKELRQCDLKNILNIYCVRIVWIFFVCFSFRLAPILIFYNTLNLWDSLQ